MKKIFCFLFLAVGIVITRAQDPKAVFNTNEIVWYGLDFTKARFVGSFDQVGGAGAATGSDMKSKWIPSWNALIINEQAKYDLKKTFRKDNVYYDISSVEKLNGKIDPDNCMSPNPGKIEQKEIHEMVKKYTGDKKGGVGLVFIVENFNKGTQNSDIYITFFDIASGKVLLSEKMTGKAMGIGMRNYWAGSIKDILNKIDKSEYKNWKNK